MRIVRLAFIAISLAFVATPAAAGHPKTDLVTLDEGSTYFGEISSVQYATLKLKTDAAGTLNIEWRRITGLTSKFEYYVELIGGDRHYGTLEPPDKPLHIKIVGSTETIEVKLSDVVLLSPVEHGFWQRLDGSVSFGLTYTQANEALQYNASLTTHYRSRKNFGSLNASSIFNTQQGGDSTKQSNVQLLLAQVGKGKWGPFEVGQLGSNPDQGYDVRTILGGGMSRFPIESSRDLLSLSLGMVYNHEEVTNSNETNDTAEFLAGMSFRHYKRDSHSPAITTSLNVFADLASEKRYRATFDFNIAWKIIHDFTFNFQISDNYDSRPPGTDSNKNNFVVVTSVGYTF